MASWNTFSLKSSRKSGATPRTWLDSLMSSASTAEQETQRRACFQVNRVSAEGFHITPGCFMENVKINTLLLGTAGMAPRLWQDPSEYSQSSRCSLILTSGSSQTTSFFFSFFFFFFAKQNKIFFWRVFKANLAACFTKGALEQTWRSDRVCFSKKLPGQGRAQKCPPGRGRLTEVFVC